MSITAKNFKRSQILARHRSDSNQGSDYIAILFFFDFKFYMTNVKNLKHAFDGGLKFLPN